MRAPVVVVNLCGAPATGKSTLASHLRDVLRPEADVFYISYDRIERGRYERSEQKPLWERETWRWARIHAIHILSDLLQILRSDGEGKIAEDILSYPARNRESKLNVVIVDDTMHLRSMRHSIMKLCQIYQCSYVPIYTFCSRESMLNRNAERSIEYYCVLRV
ncbi:uncharacterized protein [Blastocystis hominis]|uniref:Uncharacterized protein n=1 Tax=Blastocystis hominis TaxID=12968 RepID=D8M9M2_BLAHO|nr:uncharacterized protein [Blastocystis hominis]CBK24761.2 unnamed protein product [Blastocystis hominis]|eukprot:XP_012898809.1 uncharacterized protein [Blastocystis hominis]